SGAGLCLEQAVRFTVEHSKEAIQWLIEQSVPFTQEDTIQKKNSSYKFHLTREGGHSQRRIIHAADATGQAIFTTLLAKAKASSNIRLIEQQIAIDLITQKIKNKTCSVGAYVLDKNTSKINTFIASSIVLATGGASKAYLYTSNSDGSCGDGIAMAWRAGCSVGNLEFNQFHPTCLYHPKAKNFLISEALRGEGALLKLPSGEQFMHRFDCREELAPRDIVAQAIDHEMKRLGIPCVYLDITHKSADFILTHFPTIYKQCLQLNIDITRQWIPVVPAAHYTCGGIVVNNEGQTDLPGLYAIGEASFTGLHGANRMASNSLLECFVYAQSAAMSIKNRHKNLSLDIPVKPIWDASKVTKSNENIIVHHNWEELRRLMWNYVGIVRTTRRLEYAQQRITILKQEINDFYSRYAISADLIELRNLVLVSELMIISALKRKESRGLHFNSDFPFLLDTAKNTILIPAT
ncbi:UNVERIFIED_CONTAM: hypothetical protein GTU68_036600, partial [Idotea baltica]|nr:hypothetical protein [Idotea baltica]